MPDTVVGDGAALAQGVRSHLSSALLSPRVFSHARGVRCSRTKVLPSLSTATLAESLQTCPSVARTMQSFSTWTKARPSRTVSVSWRLLCSLPLPTPPSTLSLSPPPPPRPSLYSLTHSISTVDAPRALANRSSLQLVKLNNHVLVWGGRMMQSGWSSPRFSPGDKLYRIATRPDVSCQLIIQRFACIS